MQYKWNIIFGRKKYQQNQESLKAINFLWKKNQSRAIQPIETKNCNSPLETEESPTENENKRTNSPNTKVTTKQNAVNTIDTSEEITMGIINLAMTCKTDTSSVFISALPKDLKSVRKL